MVTEITLDPLVLVGSVVALIAFALGVARSYYLLCGEIKEMKSCIKGAKNEIGARINYISDDLTAIKSVMMEKALEYGLNSGLIVKNSPSLPAGELAAITLSQETLTAITDGLREIHRIYNLNKMDDSGLLGHLELMIEQMIEKGQIPQTDLDKIAEIMQDIGYDRPPKRLFTVDKHIPAILLAVKAKSLIDLDVIKKEKSLNE